MSQCGPTNKQIYVTLKPLAVVSFNSQRENLKTLATRPNWITMLQEHVMHGKWILLKHSYVDHFTIQLGSMTH